MSDKDGSKKPHIVNPDSALQKFGLPGQRNDQETAAMSPSRDAVGADPDRPPAGNLIAPPMNNPPPGDEAKAEKP